MRTPKVLYSPCYARWSIHKKFPIKPTLIILSSLVFSSCVPQHGTLLDNAELTPALSDHSHTNGICQLPNGEITKIRAFECLFVGGKTRATMDSEVNHQSGGVESQKSTYNSSEDSGGESDSTVSKSSRYKNHQTLGEILFDE